MLTPFQIGMMEGDNSRKISHDLSIGYGLVRGLWRGQDAKDEIEKGYDSTFCDAWSGETTMTDEI